MPLMRLQYRGRSDADRQAFLYENVTDGQGRRYGIKVLTGVYAASRKIVGLGMGCSRDLDFSQGARNDTSSKDAIKELNHA